MNIIVLLGPPGSGKGTQSSLIVKNFGYVHISVGDLVRQVIREKSPLGLRIVEYVNQGNLVPDELIANLLLDTLNAKKKCDDSLKIILDGFPRSLSQGEILVTHNIEISKSIFFDISLDVCLRRLLSRWTCLKCGNVVKLNDVDNHLNEVCSMCDGQLGKRDDDCDRAISRRFQVYVDVTTPLKEYYQKLGKLHIVDADRTEHEIYKDVINLVK